MKHWTKTKQRNYKLVFGSNPFQDGCHSPLGSKNSKTDKNQAVWQVFGFKIWQMSQRHFDHVIGDLTYYYQLFVIECSLHSNLLFLYLIGWWNFKKIKQWARRDWRCWCVVTVGCWFHSSSSCSLSLLQTPVLDSDTFSYKMLFVGLVWEVPAALFWFF